MSKSWFFSLSDDLINHNFFRQIWIVHGPWSITYDEIPKSGNLRCLSSTKISKLNFHFFLEHYAKMNFSQNLFGSSEKKKMPLDSTQRPLKIPQKFTIYPELG